MMMGGPMFILMFALGGGPAGDLLDFADTQMYWQMRDQRIVDVQTMSAMLANKEASNTDKLMAIRAIGEQVLIMRADPEIKDDPAVSAKALEVLTPLVDSKEPFVGQYAKRSIAWIKGVDPEPRKQLTNKDIAGDLALLPHTSQIVGQMLVNNGVGPADWNALLPELKGEGAPNRQQMLGEIQQAVLQAAMMVGNARIDAVTLGAAFLGDHQDDGYAVIVARGKYDPVGVQIAMQQMLEEQAGRGGDKRLSFYSIGEIEVIAMQSRWEHFALLMPSDEVAVLMFGEGNRNGGGGSVLPIGAVADLLNKGDAQLAFSKQLTAEIKKVDREKAGAWVAMTVPQVLKDELPDVIGPFDTAHAQAIADDKGVTEVTWKAEGADAAAIAKATKEMNEGIAEGRAEMQRSLASNPEMKPIFEPMIKMMESLHVEAEGEAMTGGVTLPEGGGMSLLQMMFMSMPDRAVPPDVVEEPLEVAPPGP